MRFLARIILAAAGLLVVASLASSVSVTTSTQVVPAQGGTYVEALVGQPGSLNPLIAPDNPCDADVAALVFSGLTKRDENGHIVPDLALGWDASEDARVYTFTLRESATWQDGVPVSSDDVALTIKATQGSLPVAPWLAAFWKGVQVEKISERSVRFTLPEPYAPFLQYTTLGLLPAHILSTGDSDAQAQFDSFPIGTGPYRVQERTRQHTMLQASSQPGSRQPMVPRLEFRYFADRATALTALKNGEVMALGDISPAEASDLQQHAGMTVAWAAQASQTVVLFNLSLPFFDDANARRALLSAIDRPALVQNVLDGKASVSDGPFLLSSWAHKAPAAAWPYSLQTAQTLLDKAGWVDSDKDGVRERNGVKLEFGLLTSDDVTLVVVAQQIAQQWTQAGAAVEVQVLDAADLAQDYLQPRRFEAALITWSDVLDDPDPYEMWHSSQQTGSGLNFAGFSSQTADEIMEQARRSGDQAERKALYDRFLDVCNDQLPALPLYEAMYGLATSSKVQAVRLSTITTAADRFRYLSEWYVMTRTITTTEKVHLP